MKHKIEIFSAGCHACKQTIETVKKLAGEHEVHIHDMHHKRGAPVAFFLVFPFFCFFWRKGGGGCGGGGLV